MDKADTIHGPMELTDDPGDLICRSLKLTGEWSFTEVRIFASLVSEQDYVWDAGAFIGTLICPPYTRETPALPRRPCSTFRPHSEG